MDTIVVKRRIEKDKGSKYFINDKEVRARDAQTFFADLSTGAHSPSIISQGRIGALVTAKPTDRRAILEEAAGISGIHVRRHESELRLNAAENNLKRADELRRQQEKQLNNLKKQALEASKYKTISNEIKKIEAGLYYIKLKEIENEIKLSKNIMGEADDDINALKIETNHCNQLLDGENSKLKPLRDKNLEILSKLQRLNLEVEKKYYELEKQTESDLQIATEELRKKQNSLENISKKISSNAKINEDIDTLKAINEKLENSKKYINDNNIDEGIDEINSTISLITSAITTKESLDKEASMEEITNITNDIKICQEKYANALSKNHAIKTESIKRHERIKNIDTEVDNWKKLKSNSDKMLTELTGREDKIKVDIDNILKLPENIAIKKGQYMQNTTTTETERVNLSKELVKAEEKFNEINEKLKVFQEKMLVSRENKARSEATLEGLKKRKEDLLSRVNDELGLGEKNIFNFSDLANLEQIPDAVDQEEKLDAKKRVRESLGSVNLRADEETFEHQKMIEKMTKDREDLISAISKLRESINELNQKGRERLLDAFEKVNRKFNDVYTKLFGGGNAKLELIESDDPLEAGLEMLVSPPGKRLQSITLLSGGEQALTALSLVFAVFLTSPAPICVLDEVDAPLDDANVTRFCGLLDELIKITKTRFIIVTHHALTMSRMNRLYGVTMPEKGISQLVAVDLERAEDMVA